uniref:hypothetical protein n=1 Tax=Agathobacter sp. TaxID=2021311 RepID=UPI004056610D
MKKSNIYKFLYALSALLVLGFAIHTIVDACRYDSMLTSFPFYVFVLGHAVVYLVPSLIVFIAALIVKKKFANKESK